MCIKKLPIRDGDYITCDEDKGEMATCINEDTYTMDCNGGWAICVDSDHDWVNCAIGENAICVDKNVAGRISSSGSYYSCAIGEYSYCQ